jgi:hypothetical protein
MPRLVITTSETWDKIEDVPLNNQALTTTPPGTNSNKTDFGLHRFHSISSPTPLGNNQIIGFAARTKRHAPLPPFKQCRRPPHTECIRSELRRDEISPRSGPTLSIYPNRRERCVQVNWLRPQLLACVLSPAHIRSRHGNLWSPLITIHFGLNTWVAPPNKLRPVCLSFCCAIDTRYCTRCTFASDICGEGVCNCSPQRFLRPLTLFEKERERPLSVPHLQSVFEKTFNHY